MKIIDLREIDLTHIPAKANRIVGLYLHTHKSETIIPTGKMCIVKENGKEYRFTLLQSVLHRKKESDPDQDRFEIISNDSLGKGGMGTLFHIEGVLAPQTNHSLQLKKTKQRVVKKQTKHPDDTQEIFIEAVDKETTVTKKVHRGTKQARFESPTISYSVMRLIKGKTLADIIDDNWQGKPLPLEKMIDVSIQILRAIQEQVHDKGIIHQDIKPENILVDLSSPIAWVNMIDFGLSHFKTDTKHSYGGTPGYVAPEVWVSDRVTEAADYYSTSITFEGFWGSYPYITGNRAKIDDLLADMRKRDPNNRASIAMALEFFEKLQLHDWAEKDPVRKNKLTMLEDAQKLGRACRNQYRELLNKAAGVNYNEVKQLLSSYFSKDILDDPDALKVFIHALGIRFFKNVPNKNELTKKMDALHERFSNMAERLLKLSAILEILMFYPDLSKEITPLFTKVTQLLKKHEAYNTGIADLEAICEKYTKHLPPVEDEIEPYVKSKHVLQEFTQLIRLQNFIESPHNDNETQKLKQNVAKQLRDYMQEFRLKKSSISKQRLHDIANILDVLESKDMTADEMRKKINSILSNVKRGIFSTNLRFFKSLGKSNLVKMINSVLQEPRPSTKHRLKT